MDLHIPPLFLCGHFSVLLSVSEPTIVRMSAAMSMLAAVCNNGEKGRCKLRSKNIVLVLMLTTVSTETEKERGEMPVEERRA